MYAISISIFLFFIFIYPFLYFFYFLGLGPAQPMWAGFDPASPAGSLAQASDLAGLSNTRALTHACCYTVQVN
jgi:hypothetical protein